MWPLRTAKRENTMREHVSKGHRYLLMTAIVMTYLLVTLGGIVSITNSSQAARIGPDAMGN